ncbi:MAG: zf-HC2 domain-containing protein [Nitriliruptoraceae bacterium]
MTQTCGYAPQDLAAFALGTLPDDASARLRTHLAGCEVCQGEVDTHLRYLQLLDRARMPLEEPEPAMRTRILARVVRRRRAPLHIAAATAAAALAAVAIFSPVADRAPVVIPVAAEAPFEAAGDVRFVPAGDGFVVEVRLTDVDPLEEPAVYEAWLYEDSGRIVSIGLATPDGDLLDAAFTVTRPPNDFRAFWITAEPDAVSPSHDGPTVVRTGVPQW